MMRAMVRTLTLKPNQVILFYDYIHKVKAQPRSIDRTDWRSYQIPSLIYSIVVKDELLSTNTGL